MELIKQLVNKKINFYEENNMNKNYKRSVWQFYNAYNLALSLTGKTDKDIKKKNAILRKFLLTDSVKLLNIVENFIKNDMKIIIEANNIIKKAKEESYESVEFYKPFSIGCLAWEAPEN